jgi:hypothetical protein
VGIGEIDLHSGVLLDALMLEHLVALIPGQGSSQCRRQLAEHGDESVAHLLRGMSATDRHQDRVTRLSFDQSGDRGPQPGADDEVALPMPDLGSGLHDSWSLVDRLHGRRLLERAVTRAAPATLVTVDPAGAQGLQVDRDHDPAVDGLVDRLDTQMP